MFETGRHIGIGEDAGDSGAASRDAASHAKAAEGAAVDGKAAGGAAVEEAVADDKAGRGPAIDLTVADLAALGGVVLDRMLGRLRLLAQVQAAVFADMVEVADLTPNPEFAAFEISSAATWTRQAATTQLDLAEGIVRRLPDVHAAMLCGDIDLPKARVIVNALAGLALPLARRVAAQILPLAPRLTTGELGPRLARMVIKADPQAAARRRALRVRKRRVEFQPTQDSCAALLGWDLPAEDALAASKRLTALARAMKQAGDPRSMDQLRADTFLNLLLGNTCACHSQSPAIHYRHSDIPNGDVIGRRPPHDTSNRHPADHHHPHDTNDGTHLDGPANHDRPHGTADSSQPDGPVDVGQAQPATSTAPCCRCASAGGRSGGGVELTGTLEMLARMKNEPGDLAGYGPVVADIARQIAEQQCKSPWTFTIRDEATGRVFTGPTRRRPTAAMAREVRARDRTCRAPGCRRIGVYADIDHTIAYEDGGPTEPGNLGLLCRYHHRAKHEGFWILTQIRPGVFVWLSPLGRRYIVYPAAP